MKAKFFTTLIVFTSVSMFSSCKTTQQSICGTWYCGSDTIKLYKNSTFSFSTWYVENSTGNKENGWKKMKTNTYKGTWLMEKSMVHFNFQDSSAVKFLSGCKGLNFHRNWGIKPTLIRGRSCITNFPEKPLFYFKTKQQ